MDDNNITKSQENNQERKPMSLWVKILVPVVIVFVIAGIFIFKNLDKGKTTAENQAGAIESAESTAGIDYSSSEFDLDATEDFDLNKLLSYGLPVIIDFGSDSCMPCKEMAPTLEELNDELRGKAIVKFVDVWVNTKAAEEVPVRVIPTQFFFDKYGKPFVPADPENSAFTMYQLKETNEHVFTSHEGGMTKEEILAVLKELGVE